MRVAIKTSAVNITLEQNEKSEISKNTKSKL